LSELSLPPNDDKASSVSRSSALLSKNLAAVELYIHTSRVASKVICITESNMSVLSLAFLQLDNNNSRKMQDGQTTLH